MTKIKISLTQREIDSIYFDLKDYVKTLNNVDQLSELNISQQQLFQTELNLIKKFANL
tara:strand:+ start:216 stop:389 length:174 start_codon:yes stop_codon:yes gene_type:complete